MYDIIKRPLVTEKNTLHATTLNEYAFEVDIRANKTEVKKAVEKLFNVKVLRVNTLVSRREPRKLGKMPGKRKLWKKAIVKLREGDKFEFVAS
jgi:large subunit ribosomal protein L23